MLTGNLEKIAEHGRRADGIVKSMLEHSRGVSGERREVDLNTLVDEALNLAYHGARAQDASFNITLERPFFLICHPKTFNSVTYRSLAVSPKAGGSTLSRSDRSRSQIARNAPAVSLQAAFCGRLSSHDPMGGIYRPPGDLQARRAPI
jgi:hypothetical protein